jgi:hypothetical protein
MELYLHFPTCLHGVVRFVDVPYMYGMPNVFLYTAMCGLILNAVCSTPYFWTWRHRTKVVFVKCFQVMEVIPFQRNRGKHANDRRPSAVLRAFFS